MKRITNLASLGIDLVHACLIVIIAFTLLGRIAAMADVSSFNAELSKTRGLYNDFRSYYACGKLAESSQRADLFTKSAQEEFFRKYSTPSGASGDDWSQIPYAPFFAVTMSALAQLPLNTAFVVWSFLGLFALIVSLPMLALTRLERPSVFLAPMVLIGLFATLPITRCLILGQASMIVTACIALFFVCWMHGKDIPAGVFMALSTFKPQFATLTFIPAVAKQKWKMLAAFLVSEIILWGGASVWLGPKPLADYLPFLINQGSSDWNQKFTMLGLRSLFSYLPQNIELPLSALVCIIGMASVFWLWRGKRDLDRSVESCWLIASAVLIYCLTSIYAQMYDAVLLAICAVTTLPAMGLTNATGASIQRKLWWAVFYSYPLLSWGLWLVLGRTNHFSYHFYTLSLMVLTPIAVNQVLRLRAASQASPAADESLQ